MEHEAHAVDDVFLGGLRDDEGRREQSNAAVGHGLAEAVVDEAGGIARQVFAVHVLRATHHGHAEQHVLAGRFFHEADGGHHRDGAGGGLFGRNHAQHAAEMIDVAVRVDDRAHRAVAEVLAGKGHRGGGGFARGQRIHDDPAGLAFDQRQIGDVEAAQLPDAVRHLEQAGVVVEPRLTPEAGVDRGGCFAVDEIEGGEIPDHLAGRITDHARRCGDETAHGVVEGLPVIEIESLAHGGVLRHHAGVGTAAPLGRRRAAGEAGEQQGPCRIPGAHRRAWKNASSETECQACACARKARIES